MDELIRSAGSFRRLMEQYWTGQLTPEQERVIEDANPKATLASYKPIITPPSLPNDIWTEEERAVRIARRALQSRKMVNGQKANDQKVETW